MRITRKLQTQILIHSLSALLGALLVLALAGSAQAQAPAGPMTPAPGVTPQAPPPSASGNAPALIGGKPNLSGLWKLNRSDSDDPRKKMQQANGNSRNRGGWGGPGGPGGSGGPGGPGGPGGGGGPRGGRGQDDQGQSDSGAMLTDLSYLTVKQTQTTVRVLTDSGHLLAQYPMPDQGNSKSSADSQDPKAGSAQWQGDQLVIVTPGNNGGKTTRTFAVSSDPSQLFVTTRMEGGRLKQPVEFRLVYDPSN